MSITVEAIPVSVPLVIHAFALSMHSGHKRLPDSVLATPKDLADLRCMRSRVLSSTTYVADSSFPRNLRGTNSRSVDPSGI
jgi:hypothetical protein